MHDIARTLALHIAGLLAFALLARTRRHVSTMPLAIAVGTLALYWLVVWQGLAWQPHVPGLSHLRWNWLGKALAISVDLAVVAALPRMTWPAVGMTWRQARSAPACTLLVAATTCAFSWAVQWRFDGHPHLEPERLLYQATMPGLDEELFWRGLLLALLQRAFGPGRKIVGAAFGPAELAVTLLFAAGHSLAVAHGAVVFDGLAFAVTGLIGAALTWLRTRTGSLVAPVLLHNLVNVGNALF